MIPTKTVKEAPHKFYGWYALSGTILVMMITGGAFVSAFAVLLPEICASHNWSRTMVSGVLSVGIIIIGLLSPLYGYLVNRFGPQKMIILGNAIAALGFACLSLIQESWHFYVIYGVVGAGCGLGTLIACTTVANNWFVRKNALAMGLLNASPGLGGFTMPLMATALMGALGWQGTYLVLAGMVVLGPVLLCGVILIKNKPGDWGQVPDGVPLASSAAGADLGPITTSLDHISANPLRHRVVWLIAAFVTANSLVFSAIGTHHVAFVRDLGFSPMTAATTMSVLSVFLILGSVAFGLLAFKFNIRYLTVFGFGLELIAVLIILTTRHLPLIFAYTIFIGAGIGIINAAMPTFIGTYFQRNRFAEVMGIIVPFHILSQALAAIAFGVIFDRTGSYALGFVILSLCILAGLISAFFTRKPGR